MQKEEMNDVNADLSIDPEGLDICWLEQPQLVFKYTKQLAKARKAVATLKENKEQLESSLAKEIRKHPKVYGVEKGTEKEVHQAVMAQEEYKDISNELIEAEYSANVMDGVVRAMEHKKKSLENLTQLANQNYFSTPKDPRDLAEKYQERIAQKQASRTMVYERMNRKKGGV